MAHKDQRVHPRKSKSSCVDLAGSMKAAKLVTGRWSSYTNISISMLTSGIAICLETEPSSELGDDGQPSAFCKDLLYEFGVVRLDQYRKLVFDESDYFFMYLAVEKEKVAQRG